MDQYVAVFGRRGAAICIDCRTLEHEAVMLPEGVALFAVNSMVKHELGRSAYPQRVKECRLAAAALGADSLRDVSPQELEHGREALDPVIYRRARHVVSENQRVHEFVAACARGDLETMGRLFAASHHSLRSDYEVSCEELDYLVEAASAMPGVLGARMTGGGFGGCTVNLLRAEAAERFPRAICEAYRQRFGLTPQVFACVPSAGAAEL